MGHPAIPSVAPLTVGETTDRAKGGPSRGRGASGPDGPLDVAAASLLHAAPALTRDTAAAARLRARARPALKQVAAPVARRAAHDLLRGARLGRTCATVEHSALAGHAAAAARQRGRAWAALQQVAAAVARRAASDARALTGRSSSTDCTSSPERTSCTS